MDKSGNIARRIKVTVTATIAEDDDPEGDKVKDEAFPVPWGKIIADLRDLIDQMIPPPDGSLPRALRARRREFKNVAARMREGRAEINELKRSLLDLDRASSEFFGEQSVAHREFIDAESDGLCARETEG